MTQRFLKILKGTFLWDTLYMYNLNQQYTLCMNFLFMIITFAISLSLYKTRLWCEELLCIVIVLVESRYTLSSNTLLLVFKQSSPWPFVQPSSKEKYDQKLFIRAWVKGFDKVKNSNLLGVREAFHKQCETSYCCNPGKFYQNMFVNECKSEKKNSLYIGWCIRKQNSNLYIIFFY